MRGAQYSKKNEQTPAFGPAVAFVSLLGLSAFLILVASLLQGVGLPFFTNPGAWLKSLDANVPLELLSNSAEVVAAVLAVAITVVAIVVELAATRYSHRITWLFVRDPVNIIVTSIFVVTTLMCLWVSLVLRQSSPDALLPNAGFAMAMGLVTLSLLILLPYFAFVFAFLSPLSIIRKLRDSALHKVETCRDSNAERNQALVEDAIDELQDVGLRAVELSDRGVAMACVDALAGILTHYQRLRKGLPDKWFVVHKSVARDPDFVALSKTLLKDIQKNGSWLEIKVMRQYLWLMNQCLHRARDIANLIAIQTKRLGVPAARKNPPLLALCIRCMNSYLRAAINAKDLRTAYYVLNQYRQLATQLLSRGESGPVPEIARHFQYYGLLGFKMEQAFLLEVAAYDLYRLIHHSLKQDSHLVDELLGLLLDLDQEIKSENGESSLLGVRRAQVQAATLFASSGDEQRLQRVIDDLKTEAPDRLWEVQKQIMEVRQAQFWEFTDRGVNFHYLPKNLRQHIPRVLHWLEQNQSSSEPAGN
ncbi:MAG: DUF2254 family protein [Xanthomonadales bacterium]|nr:DUF2254 family protein [Xanthomonadales bacterium]